MNTILVIDDDPVIRNFLNKSLVSLGYSVTAVTNGSEAVETFPRLKPDIVLSDLELPDIHGLDLLKQFRKSNPELIFIIMTGYSSVRSAVTALENGSTDYLCKPFTINQLDIIIKRSLELRTLRHQVDRLEQIVTEDQHYGDIIGSSSAMKKVYWMIEKVSGKDSTVLIQGESGTGKEIVAREIYRRSSRADKPFVPVNCASLTESILESELFGYEKGAFTGAETSRPGLFEQANHGTFFLDEIGETSPEFQKKMLRVLQEKEITRVGGNAPIPVDVRIIAATNKNLEDEVVRGAFRSDLFYRLHVVPINLPPLRDRREDIPLLTNHFIAQLSQQHRRTITLDPAILELFTQHSWQGNVRELSNLLERMVVLSKSDRLTLKDLPTGFTGIEPRIEFHPPSSGASFMVPLAAPAPGAPMPSFRSARDEFERIYLERLLADADGNITLAAKNAGVDRSYLHRLIKKFNIKTSEASVTE